MLRSIKLLGIALIALHVSTAHAAEPDSVFFAKTFKGFSGCFVMYNENTGETTVWNEEQAKRPLSPCSTFKIFNSMAALDAGAIKDENDTIRWDGEKKYYKEWEHDHVLRTAIQYSVVWFYQELASRIGEEKMQRYLNEAHYGNMDMSGGLTKFWLVSSLQITAEQQIAFLRKIPHYEVPFSKRSVDILKEILIAKQTNEYTLRGKTGSGTMLDGTYQGWYAGWLERDNNRYYFAVNILDKKNAAGHVARDLLAKILRKYKLID